LNPTLEVAAADAAAARDAGATVTESGVAREASAELLADIGDAAAPQTRQERARAHRQAWSYLAGYYRPRWAALALLAVVAAAQGLALLPPLQFVRLAIDRAIPGHDLRLLFILCAGIFLARIAGSLIALAARAISARVVKTATAAMRLDLLRGLYGLSRDFHVQVEGSRVHTRIVQQTERVDAALGAALSEGAPAVMVVACLLAMLLYLNAWLVLLAACAAPVAWMANLLVRRLVKQRVRIYQETFERFAKGVQFVLSHMELTKVRGFEEGELARQRATLGALSRTSAHMSISFSAYTQAQVVVSGLVAVVLFAGGGVAVVRGALTLGELLAFIFAASFLNTYASKLVGLVPDLIAAEESLGRLLDLSRAGPADPYSPGGRKVDFTGRVSIREATLGFRGKPVLKGVSLDLEPGANVAIVGANGAGKTTLLNLILGFCRPQAGEVLAEGAAYETLDLGNLRRGIGMVPQRPTFFAGTIAENIGYGWPQAGAAEVAAAAQRAGADAFIAAFPASYDTQIGDGGVMLSGGEAQRLAIARALVGRPRLLILDEPTNHLDSDAVSLLMRRLADRKDPMTILTVSHDPDVVRFAKTVYRLERGALTRIRGSKAS
jgi:ATP-binding cassette subfamily B protein